MTIEVDKKTAELFGITIEDSDKKDSITLIGTVKYPSEMKFFFITNFIFCMMRYFSRLTHD